MPQLELKYPGMKDKILKAYQAGYTDEMIEENIQGLIVKAKEANYTDDMIRQNLGMGRQAELPFAAKRPITYGVYGAAKETAKALILYSRYIDPDERERFWKLSRQKQTRELLLQNLEAVAIAGAKPITVGIKAVAKTKVVPWLAKHLPKTHAKLQKMGQVLTKPRGRPTPAVPEEAPITALLPEGMIKSDEVQIAIKSWEQVAEKVVNRAGTNDPVKIIEYYQGKYNLSSISFEYGTPKGIKKGFYRAADTTSFKNKKGEYKHSITIRSGHKGTTAEPGIVRHELEHIKDVEAGFLGAEGKHFKYYEHFEKEYPKVAAEIKAPTTAAQRVTVALREAKPIRKAQEAIYFKERGEKLAKLIKVSKKTTGEKGYYAELGQLKGKMSRVQFESIRSKIGQADIDDLFNQVKATPTLSEWEKLPARKGLAKLFGEYGGTVPTENELSLLNEIFGSEFVKTALGKRTLLTKAKDAGLQLANIPRSIMASFDLSAPLRQGVFLVGRPKQWVPAFGKGFHYLVSEKAYQGLIQNIKSRPTYSLMQRSKLAITELSQKLTTREEAFMSSWAEKIPLVGIGVRASGRAHTGFLNKLRADVFDDLVKRGKDLGITDPKFLKDAARFINHATGRGSLGSLERVAVPLNAFFFSPRLVTSRLNLINPAFYVKLHPVARKEALKSLFTFAATASTVSGLMALNGVKVGIDPRSADFMKLKVGNTRYDVLGGFQQPIRLAAQLISGEIVSSTTGKTLTLGEGYKPITRLGIIGRFVEYKESPIASFGVSLLRGQTSLGERVDIPTEVANRFTPMVAQDMVDLYKERGLEGIPLATPAIFGVGAQTYGGVQSYGLEGKDHPKLNTELTRLKTSMGFPSTVAFGEELSNEDYKKLKSVTGKAVARNLTKIIASTKYGRMPDELKIKMIETVVDMTKDVVRMRTFPRKMRKAGIERIREEARLMNLLRTFQG